MLTLIKGLFDYPLKHNRSGYRGVHMSKTGKFIAQISVNKKRIHLGSFTYPYTGAYAYDSYVLMNNLEHTMNFARR